MSIYCLYARLSFIQLRVKFSLLAINVIIGIEQWLINAHANTRYMACDSHALCIKNNVRTEIKKGR